MIALLFYQLPTEELLHSTNIILTIVFWGVFKFEIFSNVCIHLFRYN